MSVANLTKYACFGDGDMTAVNDKAVGKMKVYVKFEDAVEASSNSLQQLKAEIAALEKELCTWQCFDADDMEELGKIREKLRQLSAV